LGNRVFSFFFERKRSEKSMAILIKVPKKIMFLISITLPVGRVDWKGFLAKNTVTTLEV
jgi:hypothetical protein